MIKFENGRYHYFDCNGTPIVDGCTIRFSLGNEAKVYLSEEDTLGIDATNPAWIRSGRAVPCEYGLYPLTREDTEDCTVVE